MPTGTLIAQNVIDRVRTQLIEPDKIRWTDAELLQWLSDGLRAILAVKPNAFATTSVVSLVNGSRQTIPSGGHMFLAAYRNMGANGLTPGRAIRPISREVIDAFNPNWHASTSSPTVQNYILDPANFDVFYVYPPNDGTGKIEISYAVRPNEITTLNTALPLPDTYFPALVDYVLYRAHQKDDDYASSGGAAQRYITSFMTYLGLLKASDPTDSASLQAAVLDPAKVAAR